MWRLQGEGEQDVYDRFLTQAEIQGHVSCANGEGGGGWGRSGVSPCAGPRAWRGRPFT